MLTPRRVITAVVAVLILICLIRSTSSDDHTLSTEETDSPDRSYPPPTRPKKKKENQIAVQDISTKPLRDKLHFYFPYDVESRFPSFIWQTWKSGPNSGAFEDWLRPKEATWTEKHPGFVHEVILDDAAEHLIDYLYASIPEVSEAYKAMPLPVLKADFFRYLILLARGGIYADIDTEALQSAFTWLPESLDPSAIGLIIGIEADPERDDWAKWYSRRIQFCQWTIQAKPGHPVLRDIVASITEKTLQFKAGGQLVKGKQPESISILEYTGPGIWTDTIFSYFNNREYFDYSVRPTNVSVSEFFRLKEHRKIGDVMVLPITSFSPGVGHMGAGDKDDPMAFVYHDFEGSWKPEKERMKKQNGI